MKASKPYSGIVKLIIENEKGQGTGFFVNPNTISTAAHVANKGPLYFIEPFTGDPVFTEVLEIDEKYDLALLQTINYESEHFYSIGFTEIDSFEQAYEQFKVFHLGDLQKGDFVTIAGFPHGSFNIVMGTIIKTPTFPLVSITGKIDRQMSTFFGISGAPVFSKDSSVIGVATSGDAGNNTMFIGFTPIERVRYLVGNTEDRDVVDLSPEIKKEILLKLIFHLPSE